MSISALRKSPLSSPRIEKKIKYYYTDVYKARLKVIREQFLTVEERLYHSAGLWRKRVTQSLGFQDWNESPLDGFANVYELKSKLCI